MEGSVRPTFTLAIYCYCLGNKRSLEEYLDYNEQHTQALEAEHLDHNYHHKQALRAIIYFFKFFSRLTARICHLGRSLPMVSWFA